jgi:hypothetical protein
MKTRCIVTLFFQGQSMDIEMYLDLNNNVDLQIETVYGVEIDDYIWQVYNPYTDISDNQLFSMYNKSNDYKRKTDMKKELRDRGYFQ